MTHKDRDTHRRPYEDRSRDCRDETLPRCYGSLGPPKLLKSQRLYGLGSWVVPHHSGRPLPDLGKGSSSTSQCVFVMFLGTRRIVPLKFWRDSGPADTFILDLGSSDLSESSLCCFNHQVLHTLQSSCSYNTDRS